jgi:hypothetical protein
VGVGVDLQLIVYEIDDPVYRNSAAGVDPLLDPAIPRERSVRDLDHECGVCRSGMVRKVVAAMPANE